MIQTSHEKFLVSYGKMRHKARDHAFMRLYREQRQTPTLRHFSWERML